MKPISSNMVGRNTAIVMINKAAILIGFERTILPGRDEKPTLVLKYISFNDVSKLHVKDLKSNDIRQQLLNTHTSLVELKEGVRSYRRNPALGIK